MVDFGTLSINLSLEYYNPWIRYTFISDVLKNSNTTVDNTETTTATTKSDTTECNENEKFEQADGKKNPTKKNKTKKKKKKVQISTPDEGKAILFIFKCC